DVGGPLGNHCEPADHHKSDLVVNQVLHEAARIKHASSLLGRVLFRALWSEGREPACGPRRLVPAIFQRLSKIAPKLREVDASVGIDLVAAVELDGWSVELYGLCHLSLPFLRQNHGKHIRLPRQQLLPEPCGLQPEGGKSAALEGAFAQFL